MKMELRFRKDRDRSRKYEAAMKAIGGWVLRIAVVCVLAFGVVWYLGQWRSVVGDSMNPVLHNGDIVLVNQIVYDASNPKRGDVIVFRPDGNEDLHVYMKRIVGLPGETIQIKDGKLYIDGKELEEEYKTTAIEDAGVAAEEIKLKKDEYFVLGDNRMASEDSRSQEVGNVKKTDIEGKAWFVISPKEHVGFLK